MSRKSETLTLKEAANILNVSASDMIKILNSGAIQTIPEERVNMADVLKYKKVRDTMRSEALTELALIDRDLL